MQGNSNKLTSAQPACWKPSTPVSDCPLLCTAWQLLVQPKLRKVFSKVTLLSLPAEDAAVETVLLVLHSKCSCPLLVLLLGRAVLTQESSQGLLAPKQETLTSSCPEISCYLYFKQSQANWSSYANKKSVAEWGIQGWDLISIFILFLAAVCQVEEVCSAS